jgi:Ca2+-binding RTX toxin-like protein
LTGNGFANRITGDLGNDTMNSGGGKDSFIYRSTSESPPNGGSRDVIIGFNPGTSSTAVDRIDLSAIDANTSKAGNQKFKFIGTKAFSGKGQLRIRKSGSGILLEGNTTGYTSAEFEILLQGVGRTSAFTKKDFKL